MHGSARMRRALKRWLGTCALAHVETEKRTPLRPLGD
jgi:hypothetical protein